MAGELESTYATGLTCYFQLRSSTGTIWNGAAFEAYSTAHIATYAIAATEQGSASGYYTAAMPGVAAGTYNVVMKQQVGGGVAESDPTVGVGNVPWDGTLVPGWPAHFAAFAIDVSGNVTYNNPVGSPGTELEFAL